MKVGKKVAKQIVKERETNGEFKGLFDFVKRMASQGIKSNAIKNLILAGAFDDFGYRKVLHDKVDELLLLVRNVDNVAEIDNELATASADIKSEYDKLMLMQLERDMLGINLLGDPLEYIINNYNGHLKKDQLVEHLGIITAVKTTKTKKGDLMAFATVRRMNGNELRVVIFPRVYNKCVRLLERGRIIYFTGRADNGGFILSSMINASDIINNTNKKTKASFDNVMEAYNSIHRLPTSVTMIDIRVNDRTIRLIRNR